MDRNSELQTRSLARRPRASRISTTFTWAPNHKNVEVKRAVWSFRRYLGFNRFRRGFHGVMLHHRNPDKARRYLELLDAARYNGLWQEVPELVRKVRKHAPQRKCLTTTAHSEYQIAIQSNKRHSTSTFTASNGLSQLIPSLLTAIENEHTFPEDAFQAQVCLGWLHWVLAEPGLAISRLPTNFGLAIETLSRQGTILAGWTQVCLVKGAYVRGASQEKIGNPHEAAQTYKSIMPYISSMSSTSTREERLWTERLLARSCLVSTNQFAHSGRPGLAKSPSSSRLGAFRIWAKFCEGTSSQGLTALDGNNAEAGISRRRLWQAYYETVSEVLEKVSAGIHDELTTTATNGSTMAPAPTPLTIVKLRLFEELRRVETAYEGILLKEVKFPTANETNLEVEKWTEKVMINWRIICGPTWTDEEIGEGGQEAAGRNTLDILYRAATKTFHSTAILRHLFSVHTSLAEFELAGRALDSYLEIVTRGKARAEKSGDPALGLDDDDTILLTTAAGINMLCTYGRRKEAEKAWDLGVTLERWLNKHQPDTTPKHASDREPMTEFSDGQSTTKARISGKCLAFAYRAIGASQAHWARMTYETSTRADLSSKAISNLRRALQPAHEDEHNVEMLYTLGLVLAEKRDLDGAIAAVKEALAVHSRTTSTSGHAKTNLGPDRNAAINQSPLIHEGARHPVKAWHLLALLLSARQDFTTAAISCEAAFEQIEGLMPVREHSRKTGPTNSMGQSEKQDIVEIKMTQIALAEVFDGPEVAVNASGDLLDLFARLFQYSESSETESNQSHTTIAPDTSNGVTRNVRGSLFHRHKAGVPNKTKSGGSIRDTAPGSVRSFSNDAPMAPTISVTDNDRAVIHPPNHSSHHYTRASSRKVHKSDSRRTIGSVRRSRKESPDRSAATDGSHMSVGLSGPPFINGGGTAVDGTTDRENHSPNNYAADGQVGVAVSHDTPRPVTPTAGHDESPNAAQPLPPVANNHHHAHQTFPVGHIEQPSSQDVRLPTIPQHYSSSQPVPRYTQAQQQRHASTLLVKVWLLIAGLYRRASMYEDAQGALDEAFKHVKRVEAAVASQHSSAQAFAEPGWGGLKSVEELWADTYSEKGTLCVAQSAPHEAMANYELAISHFPDHPAATVGLSTLLLDIYAQIMPAQPTTLLLDFAASIADSSSTLSPPPSTPILATIPSLTQPPPPTTLTHHSTPSLALGFPPTTSSSTTTTPHFPSTPTPRPTSSSHRKTPEVLDRLAARDRAYGLLSSLTKRGEGWDHSEAWYALARAYEEGGQVERAKEALWWVVELEEGRPVRGWGCLGRGYGL